MIERVFIVDYAYGFHADTCEVDYVCRLRSLSTIRAFKQYPHARIVLAAGLKERTGDCGPLASMMHDFLVDHDIPASAILRNPYGRDTLTETEAAYRIIRDRGGVTHHSHKIVCVTSAFHAPRVWLIWFLRFGIMPTIHVTKLKPRTMREYVIECLKIPRDVIRALAHAVSQ